MQFLMSLWCWKPNQAIKRSKITQVFGFGIEIRREGKRLITLKSEVWNWVKKGKITYRTRITSKNLQSQKEVIWKLGLAPLRKPNKKLLVCEKKICTKNQHRCKKQPHKITLKTVGKRAMEFETPDAFVVSTVWWGQARHEDEPSLLRCHLQQKLQLNFEKRSLWRRVLVKSRKWNGQEIWKINSWESKPGGKVSAVCRRKEVLPLSSRRGKHWGAKPA